MTTEIILKNDAIKQRNAERIEAPKILKHLEQEIFASEKIVSTLTNERDEMNIQINKNNLVEAHERVKNFKAYYDAFHDEIENSLPLKEQLQIVAEHDIYNKSKQYLKDIEFLKSQNEKPRTKGLLGTFGFSQPVTVKKVQDVVDIIEDIQVRHSRAEANRKRKKEVERQADEKLQLDRQKEADRIKKGQSEIIEFQNRVQKLAKDAGYPNDFFHEKFRFYSFSKNTYDIFPELGAVQKGDHPTYLNMITARYEKNSKRIYPKNLHIHTADVAQERKFPRSLCFNSGR